MNALVSPFVFSGLTTAFSGILQLWNFTSQESTGRRMTIVSVKWTFHLNQPCTASSTGN